MRNKLIALLLCGLMPLGTLGSVVVSAEENAEDSYAEKIAFTMTGCATDASVDYSSELLTFFEDKFNVEMDIKDNGWDGSAERFSLQAIGGTLYDVNLWLDFNWSEYFEYVDQGLFKAFPEDWAERWPNLYQMAVMGGYLDYLTVDGQVYGITHATYGGLTEMKNATRHASIYLRKDFAEEVGMPELGVDGTVTLSELKAYLEAVAEAGLTEKKEISATLEYLEWMFGITYGITSEPFMEEDNGYIWMVNHPEYAEFISTMQEWYADGWIDPDFYVKEREVYRDEFAAGLSPMLVNQALPDNLVDVAKVFEETNEGKDYEDCIILVQPIAEDGTLYAQEVSNFWTGTVFSPDVDDAVMERILDIMDYCCSEEGETVLGLGVPEIDWIIGEDGVPEMVEGKSVVSVAYPETWYAVALFGYCVDDVSMSGLLPGENQAFVEQAMQMFKLRDESYLLSYPVDYAVLDTTAKNIYNGSVDIDSFVAQSIISTEDAQTLVTNYVEENRELWETLLNELNEFAGY